MNRPHSYHEVAAPYLDLHQTPHHLLLQFDDLRIDLKTNSLKLVDDLREYYHEFLAEGEEASVVVTAIEMPNLDLNLPFVTKERDPGKTSLKEQYVDFPDGRIVRKIKTGMIFMFGDGDHYAFGSCIENQAQIINFLNNRFIEIVIKRGSLLFHAAGVAVDGLGLSLAGFSGAGKSTLALHIMRRGTDFISNDRLMVRRRESGLEMIGVPKMPRVNPGTVVNNPSLSSVMSKEEFDRFSRMPTSELWDLEHKYDAMVDTCFGPNKFKLRAQMAGLILLHWKRTDDPVVATRVNLKERRDLMPAFMKDVGLFFEMDDPAETLDFSEQAYLALLDDCPVLELTGGIDFDAATEICLAFLQEQLEKAR
ncbi:HprK-related kinase B [Desulfovibrio inopinatus]|uniref:HprK-related kinase B n=1 Tax=Desulfovibrio inopinatus TaxID=102109 RepID=UPI00041000B7|nr:HprK-related kinase B [Desulfovibrio inopinatus]